MSVSEENIEWSIPLEKNLYETQFGHLSHKYSVSICTYVERINMLRFEGGYCQRSSLPQVIFFPSLTNLTMTNA